MRAHLMLRDAASLLECAHLMLRDAASLLEYAHLMLRDAASLLECAHLMLRDAASLLECAHLMLCNAAIWLKCAHRATSSLFSATPSKAKSAFVVGVPAEKRGKYTLSKFRHEKSRFSLR
ncbi:hypothetical protein [Metalysinibacillus jejuensis]|uniref:hypothetical protein n=1 Tax=Metalysinibacillus jejuensis TaxID=914327 RepID=UPI000D35C731|nr:hypothetical protein [Metalysinibacillus jejuensis]